MTTLGRRAGWRTSTRSSNGGNCVEVDFTAAGVEMRDSKAHGYGPIIGFTPIQWAVFVSETVRELPSAELPGAELPSAELPSANGAVTVTHHDGTQVRSTTSAAILNFTPGEWAAFVAGARDGEFDYHVQVAALVS